MQPDVGYAPYTTFGFDTNIFKVLFENLSGSSLSFDSATSLFLNIWTLYSVLAFAVSFLFIVGIVYSYIRLSELGEREQNELLEKEKQWKESHDGSSIGNNRWESVQTHLSSSNPNDWKLAIIEADVLLDHMLTKAGYAGNTIADKLRSASGRSFSTIEDAWQAHRVRNQIAHGGADFVLTHKIAKETLIMYERVFKEFDVI